MGNDTSNRSHWLPDNASIQCMSSNCNVQFTLLNRRHHCRMCGQLFCNECCPLIGKQRRCTRCSRAASSLRRSSSITHGEQHLLDMISRVQNPRDSYCILLGKIWLEHSGALKMKKEQQRNHPDIYKSYYLDAMKDDSDHNDDVQQVLKDIPRTFSGDDFNSSMTKFFEKMSTKTYEEELKHVLFAFIVRNHGKIGYCQGMNIIAAFILAFVSNEEDAFWIFIRIIECIRLKDFYSPSPFALNGFQIDTRVAMNLVNTTFPWLKQHIGGDNIMNTLFALHTPKWLLTMCIGCMPLECTIVVWCEYFSKWPYKDDDDGEKEGEINGEHALFRTILTIIGYCSEILRSSNDLGVIVNDVRRVQQELAPKTLLACINSRSYRYARSHIQALRLSEQKRIAQEYHDNKQKIGRLSMSSYFTRDELYTLEEQFHELCSKDDSHPYGFTRDEFILLMQNTLKIVLPIDVLDRLFWRADLDSSGILDFRELICMLSILTRGSAREKLDLCFCVYDLDSNGYLDQYEIKKMVQSFTQVFPYEVDTNLIYNNVMLADSDRNGKLSWHEFVECSLWTFPKHFFNFY